MSKWLDTVQIWYAHGASKIIFPINVSSAATIRKHTCRVFEVGARDTCISCEIITPTGKKPRSMWNLVFQVETLYLVGPPHPRRIQNYLPDKFVYCNYLKTCRVFEPGKMQKKPGSMWNLAFQPSLTPVPVSVVRSFRNRIFSKSRA